MSARVRAGRSPTSRTAATSCSSRPPSRSRPRQMASLAAALKSAIQVEFQLEDSELAAEPLPSDDDRRLILFYESAEGGAGVLRRLVDEPDALPARRADGAGALPLRPRHRRRSRPGAARDGGLRGRLLRLPADLRQPARPPPARPQAIRDLLLRLATAGSTRPPAPLRRRSTWRDCWRWPARSWNVAGSSSCTLTGYVLPTTAQRLLAAYGARPDFLYDTGTRTVVFIDGPVHDYAEHRAA